MANRKSQAVDSPYPSHDYQCDEDVRTLSRAAEVMADNVRRKKAVSKFQAQQAGANKLLGVLTSHRLKGR